MTVVLYRGCGMADLVLTDTFADLPHIAFSDPRPAIDGEMSDLESGEKV